MFKLIVVVLLAVACFHLSSDSVLATQLKVDASLAVDRLACRAGLLDNVQCDLIELQVYFKDTLEAAK